MKLKMVTFSGPDDDTDIKSLCDIQGSYPQVEIGVLWSPSKAGGPRYASLDWIDAASKAGLKFSLHLCGAPARQMVEQRITPVIPGRPSRIQINMNGMKPVSDWVLCLHEIRRTTGDIQFIVQTCNAAGAYWVGKCEGLHLNAVPLYDKSGGKGVYPDTWPSPLPGLFCGYAGGIGPENVFATVDRFQKWEDPNDFWIDMETKVRDSNNQFDLEKVRLVIKNLYG